MLHRLNCWEFKNCGREPEGVLADQLGVCPVALEMKQDGNNGGRAAGRVCWTVPVADQTGQILKSCADKACLTCTFYTRVQFEEQPVREDQRRLTIVGGQSKSSRPVAESIEVARSSLTAYHRIKTVNDV